LWQIGVVGDKKPNIYFGKTLFELLKPGITDFDCIFRVIEGNYLAVIFFPQQKR